MSGITEEEAKTKWCPFARQMVSIETVTTHKMPIAISSANRFEEKDGRPTGTLCFASDCMAWRWANKRQTRGFCGLAGAPHVG